MSTETDIQELVVSPAAPVAGAQDVRREPAREATVMELATVVAESRAFPDCRNPAAAAVRILAGREMGVGPIASVIGIRVSAGRVSMDAAILAGVVKRSERYDYEIQQHDHTACDILFTENGKALGHSVFTMTDAKTAGLANKDTWKAYPRNMLFARALTNGARWYCAALFGGAVYSHEELGYRVDEEGRAVDADGNGNGHDAGGGTGAELCTREQRQEIARLVEAAGKSMPGFLAENGIKLLDEFSQWEADKAIKALNRKIEKAATKAAVREPANPPPVSPDPAPTHEAAASVLTEAQTMMADAFDEMRRPISVSQRSMILALAEKLEPDEDERYAMTCHLLGKYGGQVEPEFKLAALNHLQAASIIEALEKALQETPPFDPAPATGK